MPPPTFLSNEDKPVSAFRTASKTWTKRRSKKLGEIGPTGHCIQCCHLKRPQNHAKSLIFMLDGGSGSASKTSLLCNSVPSSRDVTTSGKAISTVSGNSPDSVTSLGVKELGPHICITKTRFNSAGHVHLCFERKSELLRCIKIDQTKRWQRIWRRRLATRSEFIS